MNAPPITNLVAATLRELLEEAAAAGRSQRTVAAALGVPQSRLSDWAAGKRRITAEVALRFARYWGTSAQYWLNMQSDRDRRLAERRSSARIAREVQPWDAAEHEETAAVA